MSLLLDTQALLWSLEGNPRLSAMAQQYVTMTAPPVYVSIASIWELAIKISVGKFALRVPLSTFVTQQIEANAITILTLQIGHLERVATLPLHHKDPFDRLIVAQALAEKLPLVSADAIFDVYGVRRIW